MNTEYYNWNTYINDRAIVEFEHEMGLQHNQINMNRYYVLSFLIKIFIKSGRKSNIITRYFDQEKYIYVSSSFVLNNLRLLKLKRRAFVKILEELEKHEYIIRYINHNQRFIKINNKLLEYYDKDFDLINKDPNIKNLSFRLGNIFAKTTDFQREDINRFLLQIEDIGYFQKQLEYFVEYKDYTNESMPRFRTFEETWDDYDWKLLLDKVRHKEELNRFKNLS